MEEILNFPVTKTIDLKHVAILFACVALSWVISLIVAMITRRMANRSPHATIRFAVADSFNGPLRWAILVIGSWIGFTLMLAGPQQFWPSRSQFQGLFAAELPIAMWFAFRLSGRLTDIWELRAQNTESTFDDQLVPIVRKTAKVLIVAVGSITMLQALNYPVGSLIAGLGIGGMAFALASKDTIANLFGSVVIFVDRPFQVGDWVEIGDYEGTVEEVGLRVTRIRTFANSLITVPNGSLTTTPINNWSRMQKRRIKLTLGLTYDTTPKQMQAAVEQIREVLRNDSRISQEFFLVNFTDFGPSSLDIFVYAFTISTNWQQYLQTREEVMLKFMQVVEGLGLSFAFPTQTVHLQRESDSMNPMSHSAERRLPR